ncbi:membrane-anchored ubiquitin-fold protein 5 [Brassica rapa]|nr:membrane-anchored ubiquitin-fold protein 5 [Brassica rapa]XP_013720106.2 membrane-anchored ubiquitin-fold protein 5 isoform X2 [Brassica napus]
MLCHFFILCLYTFFVSFLFSLFVIYIYGSPLVARSCNCTSCSDSLILKMGDEGWIELKFRLADGTDIGPSKYSQFTTVASLKENIIAQWPKDKENGPKMINEIKLINGGKILENNTTISEARSIQICEHPGMVTTVHVVLPPPIIGRRDEKLQNEPPVKNSCVCCIL